MLMMERSSDNDIFCGRGKGRWNSPGNLKLKEIVLAHLPEYANAPTKTAKSRVVEAVVSKARDRQLRFVKEDKDNGSWYEITQPEIRAKVAHCVRDQYQSLCKKNLLKPSKEAMAKKKRRAAEAGGAGVASPDGIMGMMGAGGANAAASAMMRSAAAGHHNAGHLMNMNMNVNMNMGMNASQASFAGLDPETAALLATQRQRLANLSAGGLSSTSAQMPSGAMASSPFHHPASAAGVNNPASQLFSADSQIGSRAMPSRLFSLSGTTGAPGQMGSIFSGQAMSHAPSHDDVVGSLAMMRNSAAVRAYNSLQQAGGLSGATPASAASISGLDYQVSTGSGLPTDGSLAGAAATSSNAEGGSGVGHFHHHHDDLSSIFGASTGASGAAAAAAAAGMGMGMGVGIGMGMGISSFPHSQHRDSLSHVSLGPTLDAHSGNKLLGLGGGAFHALDGANGAMAASADNDSHNHSLQNANGNNNNGAVGGLPTDASPQQRPDIPQSNPHGLVAGFGHTITRGENGWDFLGDAQQRLAQQQGAAAMQLPGVAIARGTPAGRNVAAGGRQRSGELLFEPNAIFPSNNTNNNTL